MRRRHAVARIGVAFRSDEDAQAPGVERRPGVARIVADIDRATAELGRLGTSLIVDETVAAISRAVAVR